MLLCNVLDSRQTMMNLNAVRVAYLSHGLPIIEPPVFLSFFLCHGDIRYVCAGVRPNINRAASAIQSLVWSITMLA